MGYSEGSRMVREKMKNEEARIKLVILRSSFHVPMIPRMHTMSKVLNFNAGPAMLPPAVLEQVQAELRDYQGRGMSIMEMSHRSKEDEAVNAQAEASLKRLLNVGDRYRAVLVPGGACTRVAMLPVNF